jgi:kynurenine formamidase
LTAGLAEQLIAAGVTLVGIDSFNIDSTDDGSRPVHSALLGAGIPIVEHLCNLAAIPNTGARFYAVPVKVKGMGTFPVRAFAKL